MPRFDINSRLVCYVFQNMADELLIFWNLRHIQSQYLKILVYWINHSHYIGF